MQKYWVTVYEERSFVHEIEANNPEHAKELAERLELKGEPHTANIIDIIVSESSKEGP